MGKALSDMTIEELWQLFPIILKEHNKDYKLWYQTEKDEVIRCLDEADIERISHIGSTAVEGLLRGFTISMSEDMAIGMNCTSVIILRNIARRPENMPISSGVFWRSSEITGTVIPKRKVLLSQNIQKRQGPATVTDICQRS